MKYGIEVEGKHKGLPTIFLSSDEFFDGTLERLFTKLTTMSFNHVYLSDHLGSVNIDEFLNLIDKRLGNKVTLLTVETSFPTNYTDSRVTLMFKVVAFDTETFDKVLKLNPKVDQIKLELGTQQVLVASPKDFIVTYPKEFIHDVELNPPTQIFYIPIEPLLERYTEQWYRLIPPKFTESGFDVTVIDGIPLEDEVKVGTFLDINSTVHYKMTQLAKVSELFNKNLVRAGAIFFVGDAEFWGLESIRLMSQMNKVKITLASFLHAGSYTKEDAFEVAAPYQKFTEVGWIAACDLVFVGSKYHKEAFIERRLLPLNLPSSALKDLQDRIVVTGNPLFAEAYKNFSTKPKLNKVVLTNRLDTEKRPLETLAVFRELKKLNPNLILTVTSSRSALKSNSQEIVDAFTQASNEGIIELMVGLTKEQYHYELETAKVMVSHSIEENFGYCIVEALHYKVLPFLKEGASHYELVENKPSFLFEPSTQPLSAAYRILDLVNNYKHHLENIPKVNYNALGQIIYHLKNRDQNYACSPSSSRS